jgi:hypothetical protein
MTGLLRTEVYSTVREVSYGSVWFESNPRYQEIRSTILSHLFYIVSNVS